MNEEIEGVSTYVPKRTPEEYARLLMVYPYTPIDWLPWCAHGGNCKGLKQSVISVSGYVVELDCLKDECQQCPFRKRD